MKDIVILIIAIAITLLMTSCGGAGDGAEKQSTIEVEIPPSIRQDADSLFIVKLSEKERDELKIKTVIIESKRSPYPVTVPGVVFNDPEHTSVISAPINGQVSRISKREGERVRTGEELFRIQSLEFGSLVSDYLIAFAEEKYQTNRLDRIRQLVAETISSESDLEQAMADYNRAAVNSRAAYSRLRTVGVSDAEIEAFTQSDKINPVLKIYSPISGVIEKNFIETGQSVNALENLSRILDNRVVLIRGYLNPDDARMVKPGDKVTISRRQADSFIMENTIASVNPGMDENSMSVVANIYAETNEGWPRPGENVRITVMLSSEKDIIMIPFEALTYDGNDAIVFVKKGDGVYEKRVINVADIGEGSVLVRGGLSTGEELAVSQVFSLKAISRFDIISEE
ncbi:MAG: efflux RND transporter periplasmic adaptor subunit [Marinilabiliaceae bacterium]|jgi:cobalt-zinc-cadmium efflux system membrane fusion protein|nr:efflux RND transporter periplasmic adaptor subunit [Marinilabiliaceae bacterium]